MSVSPYEYLPAGQGDSFSVRQKRDISPSARAHALLTVFGAQLSPSYLSQHYVENCNPRNVSLPVLNWLELKLINTKLYI